MPVSKNSKDEVPRGDSEGLQRRGPATLRGGHCAFTVSEAQWPCRSLLFPWRGRVLRLPGGCMDVPGFF